MLFAIAAAIAVPSAAALAASSNAEVIAEGKYLATVGDCIACHTVPGGGTPLAGETVPGHGTPFAGGRYIPTPFGSISTPNITSDKATGIGNWTDDDFYRAMHDGVAKDGEHLYPVFPYPWYTKVTRADVLAIKAYLFSLPPVHAPRKPSRLGFPFNIRLGMDAWDALFFHAGTFKPDPAKPPEVNRGAYLVEGLGHCGACHTPRNVFQASNGNRMYAGGAFQNWFAPNITADVREGIGDWSVVELVTYFKTGLVPQKGVAAGPMAETIHDSLRHLNDSDLHAIAVYLKSTKPEKTYNEPRPTGHAAPRLAGADAYLTHCGFCHQLNGQGIPGSVPPLAANGLVNAQGPQDVVRIVTAGQLATGTYPVMPAVGADINDAQIAEIVNYIRNAWGNRASAIAGDEMVSTIKTATKSFLAGSDRCPSVVSPNLAKTIEDRQHGIIALMESMTAKNYLQNISQIVARVKAANPQAKQADIVNSLTIAYCPIAASNGRLDSKASRDRLDRFSALVYTQLVSNGKD